MPQSNVLPIATRVRNTRRVWRLIDRLGLGKPEATALKKAASDFLIRKQTQISRPICECFVPGCTCKGEI